MKIRAAFLAFGLLASEPALAAYVIEVQQVNNNVVATGNGSINLTALSYFGAGGPNPAFVSPDGGYLLIGQSPTNSFFTGFSGPSSLGPISGYTPAVTSTGVIVGIAAYENLLVLPSDYLSGSMLSPSSSVFSNTTLTTLGLQQGVYTWTWGGGATADSFTIRVGQAIPAVPEPATWVTMLLGFGLVGAAMRYRRRAKVGARYV